MKNSTPIFRGIATALITPLTADGIDYAQFGKLIDWQIDQGINALVICGTTGESATLSDCEKLELFRAFELKKRNEIAEKYTALLKDKFLTPFVPDGFVSSWAQYTLILDSKEEREKIQEALKGKGIPSMVYYPIPMHKQKAFYYAAEQKDLEISSKTADTVLSIPMHPYLKEQEIEFVCKNLNSLR